MVASWTPCELSATVSLSGQRVEEMRRRRSVMASSGTSTRNGRTPVVLAGRGDIGHSFRLAGRLCLGSAGAGDTEAIRGKRALNSGILATADGLCVSALRPNSTPLDTKKKGITNP